VGRQDHWLVKVSRKVRGARDYASVSVADVGAVGAPSVPSAVELPVWAFAERFPVVRAGDRRSGVLVLVEGDCFGDDVSELLPGDDASSGVSLVSGSSAALLGPP